jgi:AAA domain
MRIDRVEVEGGFLDGLSLEFAAGFNVLIGPRGTGKTSIIELIRYALDLPFLSENIRPETRQHARSVLKDGSITVHYSDANQRFRVTRTGDDKARPAQGDRSRAMVLAQNEIEGIGTSAKSRLRLIDGFISEAPARAAQQAELRSIEAELAAIRHDIMALDEQLGAFAQVAEELLAARLAQKQMLQLRKELTADELTLNELSKKAQVFVKGDEHAKHVGSAVKVWLTAIRRAADITPPDHSVSDAKVFPTSSKRRADLVKARALLDNVLNLATAVSHDVDKDQKYLSDAAIAVDAQSRPIRAKLEAAQRGAGDLARRIANLEKRIAQGEALAEVRGQKAQQVIALQAKRSTVLDRIDESVSSRSLERENIAERLSQHLRPAVKIAIAQRANLSEYGAAISTTLRGTGMHAATLSEQIAARISPRHLVELVEAGDKTTLAKIVQITPDRAQRLITAISNAGTSDLVAAEVDDDVQISLLSGSDYKRIDNVSTGQRCTAIVPILLSQETGCLIIDQPEDHLDNAYIVDTLVTAVKNRSAELQVIFSTHNANVPVLGEADRVVEMGSDGEHGYREACDILDAPKVVHAITAIMEGGKEAFEQRARFYRDHAAIDAEPEP